ncbi:MAG: SRPBCC family protein [Acidimicrobiales bacterium]|nr:SRPBCC family protein [Acidimicrobiales bacterium]RZV47905.1 MAG: SRPBCC family protein [Acidimicrobiales bacterium]
MVMIAVETELDAPPDVVWDDVRNLKSHTQWMHDAESIWFTSGQTSGVGTTFDCQTKVGPISLNDVMEITDWVEADRMGVRHSGIVTGEGMFRLQPLGSDRTLFSWNEELEFPFWMGGPLRNPVGGFILKLIWKRNLQNLARRFHAGERVAA